VRALLASRDTKPLVTAPPGASLRDVIGQMKTLGISQLPIVDNGKLRGIVAEVDLLRVLVAGGKTLDCRVDELMENEYATVTPNTKVELLQGVLADSKVAIVEDGDRILGIVTQIDLIDFLAKRAAQSAPGGSVPPPG